MTRITYSDGVTPGATNTFDRLGRLSQINHGTNTTTRAYNVVGQLLTETQNGHRPNRRFAIERMKA